jgi:membrane fusion protein (multidrug efflux system)
MSSLIRFTAISCSLLLLGCGQSAPPKRPPPDVGVVVVRTEPAELTAVLPGRTSPYAVSEIRPQVGGLLKERLFTEGALVKKGQPLYQIDPAPYKAAYDNAAAVLVAAQQKVSRYGALMKQGAIAPQTYDDALAAYKQARANAQSARINLGYTRITAPISGRIGRSSVTPGALLTADSPPSRRSIRSMSTSPSRAAKCSRSSSRSGTARS